MKQIAISVVVLPVLLGLFAACGRGDAVRRKSARGESCAKTDDCEGDLRCVNRTCVVDTGSAREYPASPIETAAPAFSGEAGEEPLAEMSSDAGVEWVYSKPANLDFTKSEVTVEQYRSCFGRGRCTAPGTADRHCNWNKADRDQHPANCIDWSQAGAVCEFFGGRLPTVDEWFAEASNGGSRVWPWGDSPEASCDYAVWGDGSNANGCGRDSTWPVCSKPRGNSASGLCDMSGSVWEWTATDADAETKALCGGSWYGDNLDGLRTSYRNRLSPSVQYGSNGVRCARPAQIKPAIPPVPKAKSGSAGKRSRRTP